jgi:23S rRNA pseudouridine955/2504/2580 synthase
VKQSAQLEAYLFKDSKKSISYISENYKKGSKKIVTCYNVLKTFDNNTSILDVQIETGRTHQIRAHLSYIGYPIVGDGKYGNYEINKRLDYKTQQLRSYILKFNFTTDSGILYYLNGKKIKLRTI